MAQKSSERNGRPRRGRGFALAGGLVQPQIRKAGEARGFAVSRLLTHWTEVVGEDIARLCRPVKVGFGRAGLGATLTVLARGAAGPILQAQLPTIRERVNACYGYHAIGQIRITQTASASFAEEPASFGHGAGPDGPTPPSKEAEDAAEAATDGVRDPALRAALADLGARILSGKKVRGE